MTGVLFNVAVFNTSPDVTEMLRTALERAGIVVTTLFTYDIRDGKVDVDSFLRQHDPKVVVYDIAPPYDANWNLFLHIASLDAMAGRQIVLTSTNIRHVEALAGPSAKIYEIVGKPVDLDQIIQAVREAAHARAVY